MNFADTLTNEEISDALYNLTLLAKQKDSWTWMQVAEFLHYQSIQKAKNVVKYLRDYGCISFVELSKGIKKLKIIRK